MICITLQYVLQIHHTLVLGFRMAEARIDYTVAKSFIHPDLARNVFPQLFSAKINENTNFQRLKVNSFFGAVFLAFPTLLYKSPLGRSNDMQNVFFQFLYDEPPKKQEKPSSLKRKVVELPKSGEF